VPKHIVACPDQYGVSFFIISLFTFHTYRLFFNCIARKFFQKEAYTKHILKSGKSEQPLNLFENS